MGHIFGFWFDADRLEHELVCLVWDKLCNFEDIPDIRKKALRTAKTTRFSAADHVVLFRRRLKAGELLKDILQNPVPDTISESNGALI
jgi:hypothetical protein